MPPRRFIVAGPSGSGKSTVFPVSGFGVDCFNADDHAAQLNRGNYAGIPREIREQVNRLFESFVFDCISRRVSFALETTLRSSATFEQAAAAKREDFAIEMHYLALDSFARHLDRVRIRADKGGHSAPEPVLRAIYEASMSNLPRAIREMDKITVYDNSLFDTSPRILLQAVNGEILFAAEQIPDWLELALAEL